MGQAEGRPYEMSISRPFQGHFKGHFIWPALSLPHFTCSVVRYTLAKWIVSKNVPLQNLRPVGSGIHIQCPCGVIRLHPVYKALFIRFCVCMQKLLSVTAESILMGLTRVELY